jgi:hypothetical protein
VVCSSRNSPNKNLQKDNNTRDTPSGVQRSSLIGMDLYRLQSEELSQGHTRIRTQQNMQFIDAGLDEVIPAPPIGSFHPNGDSGARLGDFLSRPVQIDTFTWSEGNTAAIQDSFNPWQLYFSDPGIKRKLDNYKLIRCKLHLKFVVNASPFFYGSLRVSYCPLADGHDDYRVTSDQIKLSQTPGLFLEPANMTSSEMELPFIWPNAWLNVADSQEFINMGRIQYVLYAKLRSANGVAAASVRVACYAWATDVEVAGLTTAAALQSDEYEEPGVISGPASAVARIASRLSQTPVIGGLATATAVGANIVSDVARAFGFSNPPVINDVMPYAPKAFHSFSSVDTSLPMDKLSVDPKNEVTIDNSVAGDHSHDPLILKDLLCRDSFLQGTLWQGADAENKILWSAPVTPINFALQPFGSQSVLNSTPASYMGRLFKYWRGGMTYRFRFIKSRYHTGRLIITWDPNGTPNSDYETTTMVRVVDLQHEDEVVITIPYKQPTAWSLTLGYPNNYSNGATPSLTYAPNVHNGIIQVRVLTTLTGPTTLPEIDILTFVSCADDIEMAVPEELPQSLSAFTLQSADVSVDDFVGDVAGVAEEPTVELVTVGETIQSLRTLLHRSSFVSTQLVGNPTTGVATFQPNGLQMCVNYFDRFPCDYGFDPSGSNWAVKSLTAGNAPFNFCAVHPLNWITNCFSGYRGSIVHHFNVETNGSEAISYFGAERDDRSPIIFPTLNARNRFTTVINPTDASSASRFSIASNSGVKRKTVGQRGMALTNCGTQSALSVVSPQYSVWRFKPAFAPVRDEFPTAAYSENQSIRVDTSFRATSVGLLSAWPVISHYVAAGVDFNPVFFVCAPSLFDVALPVASDAYAP